MKEVQRLKEMAEECRALALKTKTDAIREELLEVAERFSRLAQHREIETLFQIRTPPLPNPDT